MENVMVSQPHGGALKPIKPGEARNPNGHSKQRRDQKILSEMFDEIIQAPDKDRLRFMLDNIMRVANKGDVPAAKLLLERAYGKAEDLSNPSVQNQTNIQVNINMDYVQAK